LARDDLPSGVQLCCDVREDRSAMIMREREEAVSRVAMFDRQLGMLWRGRSTGSRSTVPSSVLGSTRCA